MINTEITKEDYEKMQMTFDKTLINNIFDKKI